MYFLHSVMRLAIVIRYYVLYLNDVHKAFTADGKGGNAAVQKEEWLK